MQNYIVIKHFQDRLTKEYYGIGATFTGEEKRVQELINGGFIAQNGTPEAEAAMQQAQEEKQAQNNQANVEGTVDEAKTVVNGKVVSLKQAQQQAKQDEERNLSGVTEKDNNATEPVAAGKKAKGKKSAQQQQQQEAQQQEAQQKQQQTQQAAKAAKNNKKE
jgi:hypothetical protein